jgi:hypothetical protein
MLGCSAPKTPRRPDIDRDSRSKSEEFEIEPMRRPCLGSVAAYGRWKYRSLVDLLGACRRTATAAGH